MTNWPESVGEYCASEVPGRHARTNTYMTQNLTLDIDILLEEILIRVELPRKPNNTSINEEFPPALAQRIVLSEESILGCLSRSHIHWPRCRFGMCRTHGG